MRVNEKEKARLERDLKRRFTDPRFHTQLNQMQSYIASGLTMVEVRNKLQISNNWTWFVLKEAAARVYLSPINSMLEVEIKQSARMKMAVEIYTMAKNKMRMEERHRWVRDEDDPSIPQWKETYYEAVPAPDYDGMARGLTMMIKLDESNLLYKQWLGLIKPVDDSLDPLRDVGPISSNEVELAERKYLELIESRITDKLEILREAQQSEPIVLESGDHVGKSPTELEEIPLAPPSAAR